MLSLFSQKLFFDSGERKKSREGKIKSTEKSTCFWHQIVLLLLYFLLKIGFFYIFLFSSPSSPKFSRFRISLARIALQFFPEC